MHIGNFQPSETGHLSSHIRMFMTIDRNRLALSFEKSNRNEFFGIISWELSAFLGYTPEMFY